jgi:hypothetical protein
MPSREHEGVPGVGGSIVEEFARDLALPPPPPWRPPPGARVDCVTKWFPIFRDAGKLAAAVMLAVMAVGECMRSIG